MTPTPPQVTPSSRGPWCSPRQCGLRGRLQPWHCVWEAGAVGPDCPRRQRGRRPRALGEAAASGLTDQLHVARRPLSPWPRLVALPLSAGPGRPLGLSARPGTQGHSRHPCQGGRGQTPAPFSHGAPAPRLVGDGHRVRDRHRVCDGHRVIRGTLPGICVHTRAHVCVCACVLCVRACMPVCMPVCAACVHACACVCGGVK